MNSTINYLDPLLVVKLWDLGNFGEKGKHFVLHLHSHSDCCPGRQSSKLEHGVLVSIFGKERCGSLEYSSINFSQYIVYKENTVTLKPFWKFIRFGDAMRPIHGDHLGTEVFLPRRRAWKLRWPCLKVGAESRESFRKGGSKTILVWYENMRSPNN